MFRHVQSVRLTEHKQNWGMRKAAGVKTMGIYLVRRRQQWDGYGGEQYPMQQVLNMTVRVERLRPRLNCMDTIRKDMRTNGMGKNDERRNIEERFNWLPVEAMTCLCQYGQYSTGYPLGDMTCLCQ